MSSTRTPRRPRISRTFRDMAHVFPPHAIRDPADYDETVGRMEALLRLPRRTAAQEQFLETLTQLVHAYDDLHYAEDLVGLSPRDVLKTLLDGHGLNASDLGEMLGNRSLGSKILRGERELSKAHIGVLCDRFRVGPELFL